MRLQNFRDVVLYEINGFHKISNAVCFFYQYFRYFIVIRLQRFFSVVWRFQI